MTSLELALAELEKLETLQIKKVIDLARRLKPGLTAEDIRNPHDFPELEDPDWHYQDGVLTGVQSAIAMLRSMRNDAEDAAAAARTADGPA